MTENIFCIYTLFYNRHVGIDVFFHFHRRIKMKLKMDAAQFLDACGDEKQVTNLERPYLRFALSDKWYHL